MSYFQRFDRYEIFDMNMMQFHADTISQVEDFFLNSEEGVSMYNQLTNKLYGIWDGFLYTDLLQTANEYKVGEEIIERIKTTIDFITEKNHNFETV